MRLQENIKVSKNIRWKFNFFSTYLWKHLQLEQQKIKMLQKNFKSLSGFKILKSQFIEKLKLNRPVEKKFNLKLQFVNCMSQLLLYSFCNVIFSIKKWKIVSNKIMKICRTEKWLEENLISAFVSKEQNV